MSNQFWNQDDNEDFRDIPEETQVNGQSPAAQLPIKHNPPAPTQQVQTMEHYVDSLDDSDDTIELEEEDYSSILSDARLRLEQGKLYELIMNHDIFAGVDADEKAVKNVQKEMRRFAKERMEIMLGMRQEKVESATIVSSPFNDLEVEILKSVAARASGGATQRPDANKVATTIKEVPKKLALNPIGKPAAKPAAVLAAAQKKLAPAPAAPVKRQPPKAPVVVDGVTVSAEELEYKPLAKPATEMTEQEKLDRNKEVALRQAGKRAVKAKDALPMATPDQEYMIAQQSTMNLGNSPSIARLVNVINSISRK